MRNGMQAIKDAGIVVVVILLLVSVRFSPLDETGQELGIASLTPQVEAAPATFRVEPAAPASAAVVSTSDEFLMVDWVLSDSDEISHTAEINAAAVEHCTEVLFHIRKAAEETRNEAIVFEADRIVKVLPCSA